MKLCKNEYTIWESLKKLKSSRENGETGRYQNDKMGNGGLLWQSMGSHLAL